MLQPWSALPLHVGSVHGDDGDTGDDAEMMMMNRLLVMVMILKSREGSPMH